MNRKDILMATTMPEYWLARHVEEVMLTFTNMSRARSFDRNSSGRVTFRKFARDHAANARRYLERWQKSRGI